MTPPYGLCEDWSSMSNKQKKLLRRILAAAALLVLLGLGKNLLPFGEPARTAVLFALYLIPYYIVGHDILAKAWRGIRNGRVLDECFLMAIATVGAFAIALLEQSGEFAEAVAVMLFFQTGELFESYAVGKSRKNISQLMDIRPDYANVEVDGKLTQVDPDEVEVGTIIVVRPGEKVPIDGVVEEGQSSLNTSALTGESMPREIGTGDSVISGCINLTGVLKIRTTTEFGQSTVSKILELVENASSRKSKSEDFISKFARVYTPAVCGGALALAVLPPIAQLLFGYSGPVLTLITDWLYRALTFLVISCPCALVISIPLSFFAGIGGASNQGILVKGSNYLETLSQTTCVVFDKTGTLTKGVFAVSQIHNVTGTPEKLLEYAAYAESASSHPIARSILTAYGLPLEPGRVTDIQEKSGHGITASVDGVSVAAGNEKLMKSLSIPAEPVSAVGTVMHMAVDGAYAGYIVVSDTVKDTAKQAVAALKKAGVKKTVMLTGDAAAVANAVAKELGIDEVYSELLPGDKVARVEEILAAKGEKEKLAFVGDGINDAPVLARADIGIAMGAMGSDAAIEAADVVLMDDNPLKIAKAIKISRKCLSIVKQNIGFAIGVKAVCLILGALGLGNMWLAIVADVGVMILAVLNAIRALFVKNL